jgi:hypothetical protein
MSMITPARNSLESWKNRVLLYKKPFCCQENIEFYYDNRGIKYNYEEEGISQEWSA